MTSYRFLDAQLKIERAYQHITDIETRFDKFLEAEYYPFVGNSDTDRGNKALEFIKTKSIPVVIPLIVGDAIHNTRAALDLVVSQIEREKTGEGSEFAKLPFGKTRDALVGTVNGSIKKFSPVLADFIIDVIKPYRGGNDFLYALHDLDIRDKHRLIVHTMTMTKGIATVEDHNGTIAGSLAYSCAISFSGDITQTQISKNLNFKNYRSDVFDIFFDKGLPVEGKPVIPTLHQFVEMVTGYIETIEGLNI